MELFLPPPLCSRCGLQPDDLVHRFWECPALESLRTLTWPQVQDWPPSVLLHGVVPIDSQISQSSIQQLAQQAFALWQAAEQWPSTLEPLTFAPLPFTIPDRLRYHLRHAYVGGGVGVGASASLETHQMVGQQRDPPLDSSEVGNAVAIGSHRIIQRPAGAYECRLCARMRGGDWKKVHATFKAAPCEPVHLSASAQDRAVRLEVQRFLNDIRDDSVSPSHVYPLVGHDIRYLKETRTIVCDKCVRRHPKSKLSAFLMRQCKA